MSGERDHRLTGLELYSLERAGYFVRRELLDKAEVASSRADTERATRALNSRGPAESWISQLVHLTDIPAVGELASDLPIPGDMPREMRRTLDFLCLDSAKSPWERGIYLDPSLPPARQLSQLHTARPVYHILVALGPIDSILVVPGSQAEPPSESQWAAILSDPFSEVSGSVRLRLDGGDALVFYNGVLRRVDPGSGDCDCLREWPALHYTTDYTYGVPAILPDLSGKPR